MMAIIVGVVEDGLGKVLKFLNIYLMVNGPTLGGCVVPAARPRMHNIYFTGFAGEGGKMFKKVDGPPNPRPKPISREEAYRRRMGQNPSANVGSSGPDGRGDGDASNLGGWLKTEYVKKALLAMIKNERRHEVLCRKIYKDEYIAELDDRLSDLKAIEDMVGEI